MYSTDLCIKGLFQHQLIFFKDFFRVELLLFKGTIQDRTVHVHVLL